MTHSQITNYSYCTFFWFSVGADFHPWELLGGLLLRRLFGRLQPRVSGERMQKLCGLLTAEGGGESFFCPLNCVRFYRGMIIIQKCVQYHDFLSEDLVFVCYLVFFFCSCLAKIQRWTMFLGCCVLSICLDQGQDVASVGFWCCLWSTWAGELGISPFQIVFLKRPSENGDIYKEHQNESPPLGGSFLGG